MTKKTLEQLREMHSELCARAHDKGVEVPADLTIDFDTALVGQAICTSLANLIGDVGVAEGANEAQDAPETPKSKKTARAAKAKKTKPAESAPQERDTAAQQQESKVATAKKATKSKGVKKATKKKVVAKKGAAKKGAAKKTRGDSKTAKVVAMLKNGGCTREQVLKLTGWKAVSMQQLAKNAGVKLKVSEERPFTYKAA